MCGMKAVRTGPLGRFLGAVAVLAAAAGIAVAQSTTVVISQVYGGGGNANATFNRDFVELHNKSGALVNLSGWSIQYAAASPTTGVFTSQNTKALSGTIPAGGYFLIGLAYGANVTFPDIPTPDLDFPLSTNTLALGAGAGKVALVNTTTPLATLTLPNSTVVDLVAYGSGASPFEGAGLTPGPTPAPSAILSVQRKNNGALDTDNNSTDFEALAVAPRNSATPPSGGDSTPPALAATDPLSPANGATGVLLTANLGIKFSEPVTKGTGNIELYREAGVTDVLVQTFTPADGVVSGDTVTYDPTSNLNPGATYYVVVSATAIKDFAGNFFAGLPGTGWTFSTGTADVTPPVATLSPANGGTGFLPTADLVVTYNEPVIAGAGSIVLRNPDSSPRETFTLPNPAVTISGSTLTINPAAALDPNTTYSVVAPAGIVTDLSGNPAAAITTWSFTTRPVPAVLISQYHEGVGTGSNRFIELKNTTASPVSLAGYQLVAWSPTDGSNQNWKVTPGTTNRVTNFSNELSKDSLLNITIPANGNYLVMLPGSVMPLDSSNNADLVVGDTLNPAATFFSGTASIVLYSAANFDVASIVDAVSIVTTEGTDTTFYRLNNSTGFDLTVGTSVSAYPAVWGKKTVPEVNSAVPADEWYLKGAVTPRTLTLTFSPSTISESAGLAATTGTITRTGPTTDDAFITLVGSDESEASVPFFVMIPAGQASATFTVDAVDDTVPDGTKTVRVTGSGPGFYSVVASIMVTDDGDPPLSLVINEVESDSPGDDIAEFIEIYNNASTPRSLDGLILVFFNGGQPNDPVYLTVPLSGEIPANGYFVVGNAGVSPNITIPNGSIQNGADGVALCMGTAPEFPTNLPAASVSVASIVDAVVYGTNNPDDTELMAALGVTIQLNEGTGGLNSLARVPDGGAPFNSAVYVAQLPTPGATNVSSGGSGFATWLSTYAPGQTLSDDHDNDGIRNGLEYFFGATGSTFTPNPSIDATGKIKWPYNSAATDFAYEVQTSTDLVIWDPVPTANLDLVTNPGFITYTPPLPVPGTPVRFTRILVEPAAP